MFQVMQVRVEELIPYRGVAIVKEKSTSKMFEVRLLPIRTGRTPRPGEEWLIDRQYEAWTFASLLRSPLAFQPALHAGVDEPPGDPQKGDRWANLPVKEWDGTAWVGGGVDPGDPGTRDLFQYDAPAAQTTHTVTHNLGYDPVAVQVLDLDDSNILVDGYAYAVISPGVSCRVSFDVSLRVRVRLG